MLGNVQSGRWGLVEKTNVADLGIPFEKDIDTPLI